MKICSCFLVLALLIAEAASMAFMPLDDSVLASGCALVVRATVEGPPNATFCEGVTRPLTRYSVRIDEVLRANLDDLIVREGQTAVVVVNGGYDPVADVQVSYPGAPDLDVGGQYILFADSFSSPRRQRPDHIQGLPIEGFDSEAARTILSIHQFAMGAFRRATHEESDTAVAVCDGIDHIVSPNRTRHFDRFAAWIKSSKNSVSFENASFQRVSRPENDYWLQLAPASVSPLRKAQRAAFVGNQRFCEFDEGTSVAWYSQVGGQPTKPNGYLQQFEKALYTFRNQGTVKIDVYNGGSTPSTAGLLSMDGKNTIIFDDPNDEIPGSMSGCGGILGVGGWRVRGTCLFRGVETYRIVESDIVIQDGIETCSALSALDFEELYAHELGHGLGMAHEENVPDALMYPTFHGDDRGARFAQADVATLQFSYCSTYPTCLCKAVSDETCYLPSFCGTRTVTGCGASKECGPCDNTCPPVDDDICSLSEYCGRTAISSCGTSRKCPDCPPSGFHPRASSSSRKETNAVAVVVILAVWLI